MRENGRDSGVRWERAGRAFFARGASALARRLIGARLVRVLPSGVRLSGEIVEAEAYVGVRDRASHAFGGRRTPRNEAMYAREGTAYVYFTYGMHWCFNVVCAREGVPEAVLLRALRPGEGLGAMRRRRGRGISDLDLCRGPARLCRALGIDARLNALDMCENASRLFIEIPVGERMEPVERAARIGIGSAGVWKDRPLRWLARGSVWVSVPKPGSRRGLKRDDVKLGKGPLRGAGR